MQPTSKAEEKKSFVPQPKRRGRGAVSNASGRFEKEKRNVFDDGWNLPEEEETKPLKTEVFEEVPKRIITYNNSPDIPFDRSINPYRGCEHGCIYCFARPTHAYMGLSPGLDFETRLFAKPNAIKLLERELRHPNYRPRPISIGTNTDPYQPIERKWRLMLQILEVLESYGHPVSIVTKSALVLRDQDILVRMAKRNLVHVAVSITSLDHRLSRKMEPRASTPNNRLKALKTLSGAGVPTAVMVAPVIPALNDHEIEQILEAASLQGVRQAAMIFMRLPYEIKDLFKQWLAEHYPDRKDRVMNHIRTMKGGRENIPDFHARFKGQGAYAAMIKRRFNNTCRRFHFNERTRPLDTSLFNPPPVKGEQFNLFKKI